MRIANRRILNMYAPFLLSRVGCVPLAGLWEANIQASGRYVLLQEGLLGLAVPHKRRLSPDGRLLEAQRNAVWAVSEA